MSKLLNAEDSKKFNGRGLAKNAMFYKDLLAFYDAYDFLMEKKPAELPNYCYWNGNYSLEGICLFMRDYACELGFESLRLELNYLRILYYTIASYSEGDTLVEREVFEQEFEKYRQVSETETKSATDERLMLESELGRTSADYKQKSQKNLKTKTLSGTFNVLAIFFLLLGIFCVIAPLTFYFLDTLKLVVSLIISLACVIVGVILFIVFKRLSRKYDSKETGAAYELQMSKQSKDESMKDLGKTFSNYSKLLCEKYECQNNLTDEIFGKARLSYEEILSHACDYSVLSYNIKRDCILMFKSQQKDINEILAMLTGKTKTDATPATLSEIYRKIEEKDWLFYNNLVRFAFLNKYIETAESSYSWELGSGKNKFTPFGVDIKKIAKEQVAFLKDSQSLFVSTSIDKLEKSNFLKKQDVLKIKKGLDSDEVRTLKVSYITKFYDYEKVKNYNNIFYDKKFGDGAKVPEVILEKYSKIPLLAYVKLRLLETQTGLDNSDNSVIKNIAENLFADDKLVLVDVSAEVEEIVISAEEPVKETVYECDESIEIDEFRTKYTVGGNSFIGYKMN